MGISQVYTGIGAASINYYYENFISRVVDNGVSTAHKDYENNPEKREGAVAGFEACRGKTPGEIKILLDMSNVAIQQAYKEMNKKNLPEGRYWRLWAYYTEIQWVANVVSAEQQAKGQEPMVPPTATGIMAAAKLREN